MENYSFGRSKEQLVASDMLKRGLYDVRLSPGSRGAYDIEAMGRNDKKVLVQVKASRTDVGEPIATSEDAQRLTAVARSCNAEAYIAYVVGSDIRYDRIA